MKKNKRVLWKKNDKGPDVDLGKGNQERPVCESDIQVET